MGEWEQGKYYTMPYFIADLGIATNKCSGYFLSARAVSNE